jgi:hypothetical protein
MRRSAFFSDTLHPSKAGQSGSDSKLRASVIGAFDPFCTQSWWRLTDAFPPLFTGGKPGHQPAKRGQRGQQAISLPVLLRNVEQCIFETTDRTTSVIFAGNPSKSCQPRSGVKITNEIISRPFRCLKPSQWDGDEHIPVASLKSEASKFRNSAAHAK